MFLARKITTEPGRARSEVRQRAYIPGLRKLLRVYNGSPRPSNSGQIAFIYRTISSRRRNVILAKKCCLASMLVVWCGCGTHSVSNSQSSQLQSAELQSELSRDHSGRKDSKTLEVEEHGARFYVKGAWNGSQAQAGPGPLPGPSLDSHVSSLT